MSEAGKSAEISSSSEWWKEPLPGEILLNESRNLPTLPRRRKDLAGGSDYLVFIKDKDRSVLASSFVGDMTTAGENPYDLDRLLTDGQEELERRGKSADYRVKIISISEEDGLNLGEVNVDFEQLTGGKTKDAYWVNDELEEDFD